MMVSQHSELYSYLVVYFLLVNYNMELFRIIIGLIQSVALNIYIPLTTYTNHFKQHNLYCNFCKFVKKNLLPMQSFYFNANFQKT